MKGFPENESSNVEVGGADLDIGLLRQQQMHDRLRAAQGGSLGAALARPAFDPMPVVKHICGLFKVSNLYKINPFGTKIEAWELMKPVALAVETGTVMSEVGSGSAAPYLPIKVIFHGVSPEDQKTVCHFNNDRVRCKFLNDPQPLEPFIHPGTGKPMTHDLSRVGLYSVISRNVASTLPVNMATRLNFIPIGLDCNEEAKTIDAIFEAGGAVRGAFASYGATADPKGITVEKVGISDTASTVVNELFYSTMALVNDSNLMNGIIHLPRDVCLAAKLPVFTGVAPVPSEDFLVNALQGMQLEDTADARDGITKKVQGQWASLVADKKKVSHFVAIPINHVLAWPLRSEDYLAQMDMRIEQLRTKVPADPGKPENEPIVLYYLVRNVDFESMVAEFRATWYGKVDLRPLDSIALEIIPELDEGRYPHIPDHLKEIPGIFNVRTYLKFVAPPMLNPERAANTIANLAPTLMPGFPECRLWSSDARAKEEAIQRHLRK